jgi:hypothetical protein
MSTHQKVLKQPEGYLLSHPAVLIVYTHTIPEILLKSWRLFLSACKKLPKMSAGILIFNHIPITVENSNTFTILWHYQLQINAIIQ